MQIQRILLALLLSSAIAEGHVGGGIYSGPELEFPQYDSTKKEYSQWTYDGKDVEVKCNDKVHLFKEIDNSELPPTCNPNKDATCYVKLPSNFDASRHEEVSKMMCPPDDDQMKRMTATCSSILEENDQPPKKDFDLGIFTQCQRSKDFQKAKKLLDDIVPTRETLVTLQSLQGSPSLMVGGIIMIAFVIFAVGKKLWILWKGNPHFGRIVGDVVHFILIIVMLLILWPATGTIWGNIGVLIGILAFFKFFCVWMFQLVLSKQDQDGVAWPLAWIDLSLDFITIILFVVVLYMIATEDFEKDINKCRTESVEKIAFDQKDQKLDKLKDIHFLCLN